MLQYATIVNAIIRFHALYIKTRLQGKIIWTYPPPPKIFITYVSCSDEVC
jgi:hypothetical protein